MRVDVGTRYVRRGGSDAEACAANENAWGWLSTAGCTTHDDGCAEADGREASARQACTTHRSHTRQDNLEGPGHLLSLHCAGLGKPPDTDFHHRADFGRGAYLKRLQGTVKENLGLEGIMVSQTLPTEERCQHGGGRLPSVS